MLSLPPEGSYHFYQTPEGASVVTFDKDMTKNIFHNFVYDVRYQVMKNVRFKIVLELTKT